MGTRVGVGDSLLTKTTLMDTNKDMVDTNSIKKPLDIDQYKSRHFSGSSRHFSGGSNRAIGCLTMRGSGGCRDPNQICMEVGRLSGSRSIPCKIA